MFAVNLDKPSQVSLKRAKLTNQSLSRLIVSYSVRKSVRKFGFITDDTNDQRAAFPARLTWLEYIVTVARGSERFCATASGPTSGKGSPSCTCSSQ